MSQVILHFPGQPGHRFRQPRRVIETRELGDVVSAMRQVEDAVRGGAWAAGFLAYEAAPAFDAALVTRPPAGPLPLLWFGIFDAPEEIPPPAAVGSIAGAPLPWRTATRRDEYDADIHEIRRRIAAGDVYQVNHTLRFTAPCSVEPARLYESLAAARHGLFHALVEGDGWAVVSASPELFLDIRGRTITTRPMKGTLRRGRWLEEDRAAAAHLAASAKDRAENLMIVDLLRNDVGRVARFGSVQVPRLFDVESYPTVHQLTSTVTGELRDDVTLCDVLAATFPCGSVTGAPKVTAMRTIAELEDSPRGAYCGAVGVVRPDGSATFNVAIRTVTVDTRAGTAVYGAGGGITWDSLADAEYDEVVAKAALLTESLPPFRLLETMRMDDGVIPRLELHLGRMRESAEYWGGASGSGSGSGFSGAGSGSGAGFSGAGAGASQPASRARDADARRALEALAAAHPTGSYRVRMTLGPAGDVEVSATPLTEPFRTREEADRGEPLPARIAGVAVASGNRLLHHKTTAREVYDSRRRDFPDAFDVLLCNDAGMATEFSFGNLVALLDGRLVTPPREHGLLPGVFRAELLATGDVAEAPLALADVRRATALYHVNSVRGFTRVVL
jgi:para-aminobenzoate synthetase / 4-amino-4-deoxychorismate lyase